jgi:hypothetical protein
MSNSDTTTKKCSRATCNRILPLSSTSKTCEECRERNRLAQKASRTKKKEGGGQFWNKRKLDDRDSSERPPQRIKMHEETDIDVETADEDDFYKITCDFEEPDDEVSINA